MADQKPILLCGSAKCAMEAGCAIAYGLIKFLNFVLCYMIALVAQQICEAL